MATSLNATPEQIAVLREMRLAGKSGKEMGARLGKSPAWVSSNMPEDLKIATGRRLSSKSLDNQSLKQALLAVITERGRTDGSESVAAVDLLARDLAAKGKTKVDRHTIQHLLHSLRKQGLVSYQERRRGTVTMYSGIVPTRQNGVIVRPAAPQPTVKPVEPESSALASVYRRESRRPEQNEKPDPVVRFPLLTAIRQKAAAEAEQAAKAEKLLDAAVMLEGVDPDASNSLRVKAETIAAQTALTPLEREYLAYATPKLGREN